MYGTVDSIGSKGVQTQRAPNGTHGKDAPHQAKAMPSRNPLKLLIETQP